ncbi:MAG: heavy metal-responsive transcriptional regulator [Planctomycetes bacterium]|nr:heavy metal-responsive transcriptional regulator [Planctomycetota bacterium]
MNAMTVSKLATAAGVHIETVRFYEREGLLPKPERTSGGHRLYSEHDAERLRFIQRSKDVGFTLKEIHELLFLRDSNIATCGDISEVAARKLAEIEGKIALLHQMRNHLKELVEHCPGGAASVKDCNILQDLEGKSCCEDHPKGVRKTVGARSK